MLSTLQETTHRKFTDFARISHLVKSNDIPSESETSHIHHIIASEEDTQSELAMRLAPLKKQLDELLQYQDESLVRMRACRRINSAVRRIPPDVLSEIFKHYVPIHHSGDVPKLSLQELIRLPIARVSSLWRRVATGTAQLWTFVSVEVTESNYHSIFDSLAALWGRTNTRALALSFGCSGLDVSLFELLKTLILPPQSEYLVALYLHMDISLIGPMLEGSNFARLEDLAINECDDDDLDEQITLHGLPASLCHFTCNARSILDFNTRAEFSDSLSRLTYIRIAGGSGITSSDWFWIMKSCLGLVTCILRIDDVDHSFHYELSYKAQIIVLPALRTLRITETYYPELLNVFSFPALEDLRWIWDGSQAQTEYSVFSSLQQRSQFDLKVLVLYRVLSINTIFDVVKASPSLAILEIGDFDDIHGRRLKSILERLIYDPATSDNTALNLQSFGHFDSVRSLCNKRLDADIVELAVKMIRSRRRLSAGVTCLKSFDLKRHFDLIPIIRERLHDCCDEDFSFPKFDTKTYLDEIAVNSVLCA